MAVERFHIDKFLPLIKQHPLIDVRSPAEYLHAHIPGSINIPLFTDEERKIVGTAYKQQGREAAIKIGLDFFSPKMKSTIIEVENILGARASDNTVLLYCWRGGMRSAAIAWLLDLYGFKVYTLSGGYKKFRDHVLRSFAQAYPLHVLGGFTGSGKTLLITQLKQEGKKTIDLEALANHKGSAFGNIGQAAQPSQEMFENLLSLELSAHANSNSHAEPIWVEDESQRIGLVNIPTVLWKQLRKSPIFFLDIPFDERLEYLVSEYGEWETSKMIEAIMRIREKLGGLNAKMAIQYLESGNTLESFRILLKYYDKHYLKALNNREDLNSLLQRIETKSVSIENASLLSHYPILKTEKS